MKVNSYFEGTYPNITLWLTHGWIEIGQDEFSESFIRVLDPGGMLWEGKTSYKTLDEAFNDLEANLKDIIEDIGLE
ncbi:hypothetical protein [Crocosphaera chwakensis]|uniref:Uncharacterized protein n=1 Tax=Crocosphaera chwakensis CCY0110 TaxID=391612 RepID=A3IS71_9CHRO|nr:hypothetical protein [Crocosphaera chwakensis]EAZ90749.1 hypothetical protein CY0110_32415 [Crocosphaera chwakensis CCY0110]